MGPPMSAAGNYGRAPLATGYRGPGTAAGRPLMSQMGNRGMPMSRGGATNSRMGLTTAMGGGEARPMTSVSGAGYQGCLA
jgi:hypothetical protein